MTDLNREFNVMCDAERDRPRLMGWDYGRGLSWSISFVLAKDDAERLHDMIRSRLTPDPDPLQDPQR